MPEYSNHTFRYDHYEERTSDAPTRTSARRLQRSSRRSRKRTSSTPGMTVNARRGRRWSW